MNKKNLCVVKAVSKDETRYILNGVCFDKDHTVATSGRMLAAVTYPNGEEPGMDKLYPVIISKKQVIEIDKLFDKKSVLSLAGEKDSCTLTLTREKDKVDLQCKPLEGRYPAWQHVFPKDPPELTLSFSPYLLGEICSMATAFHRGDKGVPQIRIEAWSYNDPIVIRASSAETGQDFIGVIMPMRDKEVQTIAEAKEAAEYRARHEAGMAEAAAKNLIIELADIVQDYALREQEPITPATEAALKKAKAIKEGGSANEASSEKG